MFLFFSASPSFPQNVNISRLAEEALLTVPAHQWHWACAGCQCVPMATLHKRLLICLRVVSNQPSLMVSFLPTPLVVLCFRNTNQSHKVGQHCRYPSVNERENNIQLSLILSQWLLTIHGYERFNTGVPKCLSVCAFTAIFTTFLFSLDYDMQVI